MCFQHLPVEICNKTFTITLAQIIEVSLVNTIKTDKIAHVNCLKIRYLKNEMTGLYARVLEEVLISAHRIFYASIPHAQRLRFLSEVSHVVSGQSHLFT